VILHQSQVYIERHADKQKYKMKCTETFLLSLLGGLGPQLHESKHKSVTRKSENDTDGCISPAIVVVVQVEGSKVIAATSVLTDVAVGSGLRVDEVGSMAHALQVVGEV
jgi:hypothetical protein